MIIAEVIDTIKSFKPNQKDEFGNPLPLGSIEVRIGSHQSNLGQVRNVYARPAVFNSRIPLIGEQVMIISGPVNDWSSSSNKGIGFMYFSPLNGTDDLVVHNFPRLWKRAGLAGGGGSGQRKSDKEETGYTFPKSPPSIDRLQPFEGDDLFQGRFGQSLRFGSTIQGGDQSIYSKKPTWKGSKNGDPIIIMKVKKPNGDGKKYSVEDLKDDDSSIYLTSKQSLNSLKAGFDKNTDAKQLGNWQQGSQVVLDADRIVLNSRKDILFLIGAKKSILTGKQVIFQSDKYKVDLDDLMDFLKKWLGEYVKLINGQAGLATASGPTSVGTNLAQVIQLQTVDFQTFKMP